MAFLCEDFAIECVRVPFGVFTPAKGVDAISIDRIGCYGTSDEPRVGGFHGLAARFVRYHDFDSHNSRLLKPTFGAVHGAEMVF